MESCWPEGGELWFNMPETLANFPIVSQEWIKSTLCGGGTQYVGTRKLLSALESLAVSSAHRKTIRQSDAVEVLLRVLKGRQADGRGMALALRTLLHVVLDDSVPETALSPPLLAEVARHPLAKA